MPVYNRYVPKELRNDGNDVVAKVKTPKIPPIPGRRGTPVTIGKGRKRYEKHPDVMDKFFKKYKKSKGVKILLSQRR